MKLHFKNRLQYVFAIFCILLSFTGKATHIAGMDLTYKHVSGTTYEITAVYYRDCAGVAAPTSVDVRKKSTSANVDMVFTLQPIAGTGNVISTPCSSLQTICTGGTEPGIQKWVYRGTTTLGSQRADWEFSTETCCRNNAITTISAPGNVGTKVVAKLNNLIAPTNSSPTFSNDPFAFICINQNFTFNHGVLDANGDSLVYAFVMPKGDATNSPVSYLSPYSFTTPLSSSTPITINQVTGDINMTPNLQQITIMAVEIKEYRAGVLVGSVNRDMEMWVTNCGSNSLPLATGINGTTNYSTVTCPGQQICFNISTQDANANQNVTLTWNNGIPNATFTITPGSRPSANFCWTPTAADQGTNVFTVTVKDNACPNNGLQVFSYNVHVGGGTVISQASNISCNGAANGNINLTINGGLAPYTYVWSNSKTTSSISGLTPGTYSVVVTDASGCSMTSSATITEPTAININASSTNVSCSGLSNGQATVSVTGGTAPYTYTWTGNNSTTNTVNGLSAGTYTVTVRDNVGCSKTGSITITSPSAIVINNAATNISCNGASNGKIISTVTGGTSPYTYVWSGNSSTTNTASNLSTGTYTVTVTDSKGCTKTSSTTIISPAAIVITNAVTNVTCNGISNGKVIATVTGGTSPYTYAWTGNSSTTNTASGLSAGTYTVTVTDNNGCTKTATASVTSPAAIVITNAVTNVTCNGVSNGKIIATATGGTSPYTYVWSGNSSTTNTASGLSAGTYTVTVTDNNGCTKTATASVTSPAAIVITNAVTNVTCNGVSNGKVIATVTGGTSPYTYAWTGNSSTTNTASGLSAGTYTVTVTDNNGCTKTATASVISSAAIAINNTVTNITCNGTSNGKVIATVTGGTSPYTYVWSGNSSTTNTSSGLSAGTYTVTVTDSKGCTKTATASVTSPAAITTTIVTSTGKTTFCTGDSLKLSATSGFTSYQWNTNSTQQNIMVHIAGTYSVVVTNTSGCTATASIIVKDSTCCSYLLNKDTISCNNSTFCVKLSTGVPVTSGIIGMNYCLTYDPNVMTPTGNATLGNVVTANLTNPSGAQAQLNTNISGTVYSSIFYTSSAPSGTFWSGTGDIICVEFTLKPGISQGSYSVSACTVDEQYTLLTKHECAKSATLTVDKKLDGKIFYWNYDQVVTSPARPIVYNINNPTLYNKTTITSGTTTEVTDMTGGFVWDYTKGTSVAIEKDIKGKYGDVASTCEDVILHINGVDAYLATLISNFDVKNKQQNIPNWIPNAFQMIASDVNMDDKIRANDVSLIMSRSVRSICEYPQVWNYTAGTTQKPKPANGLLSKDWRFFNSDRINDSSNPEYSKFQKDPAYPVLKASLATSGYWRDNVPDVPFILPIADTTNGNCPDDIIYYGVMLGDVDGFWNAGDTATHSRTQQIVNNSQMIYDVTHINTVGQNKYRVAVYGQTPNTSIAFDFRMDYNESNIKNVHVSQPVNPELNAQWNDLNNSSLYLTSFTLNGLQGNTGILYYIDFETSNEFTIENLGAITSLINGEVVPSVVNYKGAISGAEAGTFTVYPNPSNGEVNYEIHVDGIKKVSVEITNVLGQVVYSYNQQVTEMLRQQVNLLDSGKGLYFVRVTVDNEINVSKIIIE